MAKSKNPAEVRGDIQKGRTGDKRPGFDPAAAPLETDSEAGGFTLSPKQIEMSADARQTSGYDADSYVEAMRRNGSFLQADASRGPLMISVAIAGAIALAVAAVVLMGM